MPEFLEKKLKAAASKKGFIGKKADAYVYGTLNNMGAMHGSQETAKGERMQAKHEKDMTAVPKNSTEKSLQADSDARKRQGRRENKNALSKRTYA